MQLVQVLHGHHRRDQLLSDYCDGIAYKSHDLFSTVPSSLEVLAYYDDVEVCNPLGSRAKKHKLGVHLSILLCIVFTWLGLLLL